MPALAHLLPWILFLAFVLLMLVLDLGVFNRTPRAIGLGEALRWTAFWVGLAAAFALLLYFHGHRIVGTISGAPLAANGRLATDFLTAYLVELMLSIDNLFLFLLIFRHFKVPSALQHRVLFWGILGAILMRALFILVGITALHHFHWMTYLFGAFVIYAAIELLFQQNEAKNPANGFLARFAQRHLRLTPDFSGAAFTLRRNGTRYFTTLALVLVVIEITDLIFAVDSIPAVLAVTRQPFIAFTSNVFAVLGLRAFYFALAGFMDYFHNLHYGLAAVLLLIGIKMLGANYFEISNLYTLALILAALAAALLFHPNPSVSS
jgi:tellurite resistance protein TerC